MILTPDEARTALMFATEYQKAQAKMQLAQELEAGYMDVLRTKYGLDDTWICNDVLTGFEKVEAHSVEDN